MLRVPSSESPLLKALAGHASPIPPIWLMRQAGRYLPEYRKIRTKAASFLDLCLNPELAAEVTLQPLRRFDLDAAILFSDILIVPFALGQKVEFVEGDGPRLEALKNREDIARLNARAAADRLTPVYETASRVASVLPAHIPLIGFCGAPWTVATYMIEGGGSKDQAAARSWAYRAPESFQMLIDLLIEISVRYLLGQIKAGARIVQIFDSWAGSLPEDEFQRWCVEPTRRMVEQLKVAAPNVPVIGFPRGAGAKAAHYAKATKVDAIGCDTSLPIGFIKSSLQNICPVQGNLDPVLLLAGGKRLDQRVDEILSTLRDGPFIFNLGHGILPDTPVEHVARLVALVKKG
jgi:uroporphyrinogen decarboxylase